MKLAPSYRFLIFLAVSCVAYGQSTNPDKEVVDSFKTYVHRHLASYERNHHERATKLGGGWVNEYFEPDLDSTSIDVQRTSSLVSPYIGKLEFRLVRHYTAFHRTRGEAASDSKFLRSDVALHKHSYAFQDDRWVPKVRKYVGPEEDEYNCDETIRVGENAGERDIHGCLEEYDNP